MKAVVSSILISIIFFFSYSFIFAQTACDPAQYGSYNLFQLNRCKDELQKAYELSVNATKPLESELLSLQKKINGMRARLSQIQEDLAIKEEKLKKGYEDLARQKDTLNKSIHNYYIKSYYNSPFVILMSNNSALKIIQNLAFQRALANQDREKIVNFALLLTDLENLKKNLEAEQSQLLTLKVTLDEQSARLDKIVSGAKAYQSNLSGQIENLSSLQQRILTGKSSFTFSIGDSELSDDYNASIKGFREAAPSGSFAIFSFGAYTHRKGMSQYGARGRAESQQDHKAILKAYYGKEPVNKDTGGDISVQGYGSMNFEEKYLYGIAEMPSTWHSEALKAQAIAARTYAYRYKLNNQAICTTESCQVFSMSKAENPPQAWRDAVNSTRGQVLEDVVTYYASTHGVYITTKGWDTTDGSGGSNFVDKSYEKLGGSPWVYKAWYRKGYTNTGDSCGRSNPWLNQEEMADLVNAAIVPVDDRITPVTTSCWGGNPYSMQELRDKGGVTSVSSVSTVQSDGTTSEVIFQTNKGEVRLSGNQFRNAVYLRAPGYIRIPQGEYPNGWSFYNIERK